jgi:hypothetical protein
MFISELKTITITSAGDVKLYFQYPKVNAVRIGIPSVSYAATGKKRTNVSNGATRLVNRRGRARHEVTVTKEMGLRVYQLVQSRCNSDAVVYPNGDVEIRVDAVAAC